jgi:Bacterial Ig-like domain
MHPMCKYGQRISAIILFSLLVLGSLSRCAVQQAPTGGKKDSIPPLLTSSVPKNGSIEYHGKEIVLQFNEYIEIDPNIKQQLLITPSIEQYTYKPITRGIRIELEKPLSPNTTYTLNFQKVIKDQNEKNPARNLKLIFSTGNILDSLSISGKVQDLLTGKPVANAVVCLYRKYDTLLVNKHKPYYFTRSDEKGSYALENIKQSEYTIYAYTDVNNSLTYQEGKESIGFLSQDIQLDSSLANLDFNLTKIDQTPPKLASKRFEEGYYNLEFNEGLTDLVLTFPGKSYPYQFTESKSVRIYNTEKVYDSIPVKLQATDSAGMALEKAFNIKFNEPKKDRKGKIVEVEKDKFTSQITPPDGGKVTEMFKATLEFSKPIGDFKPEMLELLRDTVTKIPLLKEDMQWNNTQTRLNITKKVRFNSILRLNAPKGTFISVENDTAAKSRNDYNLKVAEDYGSISGEVTGMKSPFIVQLLTPDFKVVGEVVNKTPFTFSFLEPGNYLLRLIYDQNGNGKWDNGDFIKRKQPEKIIYYDKGTLPLKQNWELEGNNFAL